MIRCLKLTLVVSSATSAFTRLMGAKLSTEFDRDELKVLATAMDELIPQSDGMPAVSTVGGVAYVQQLGWQYENVFKEIREFLRLMQQASEKEFGIGFAALESQRQVAVMKSIEKSSAKLFSSFVVYVYEAYYTRPQVQGLLSCPIPAVAEDNDELLLEPVRKLAPLYRECHEAGR